MKQCDSPDKSKKCLYPLEIFHDVNNKNLIIATQKDVRFLNIVDGKCKVAFEKIFDEPDDEITVFRTFNFNKQAIIGNVIVFLVWVATRQPEHV